MKTLSAEFQAHLQGECLTLAQCWKLTRRDSVVMGFTDHDQPLSVDGISYMASSGFTPSAVQSQASLAVDNMDIEGMLDDSSINEADILAGLYDFAEVETFLVNYADLTQGNLNIRRGWIGEVQLSKGQFIAEIRGITQKLAQQIGELYSPICRAQLGDNRCGVDLTSITDSGTVTAVTSQSQFADSARSEAVSYYNGGVISFTSGNNKNLSRELKFFQKGGAMQSFLAFPKAIEVGDSYTLSRGCDKTITTCINRYNNALNFRGEPHVPGVDKMLETAATRNS